MLCRVGVFAKRSIGDVPMNDFSLLLPEEFTRSLQWSYDYHMVEWTGDFSFVTTPSLLPYIDIPGSDPSTRTYIEESLATEFVEASVGGPP